MNGRSTYLSPLISALEKNIPRHPICITDADHYYILDEIICQEKLIFERQIETDVESDYNHK